MNKSKIGLALGIVSLLLSTSLGAPYIKIEGIKGESKDKQRQGWIDIISVSGIVTPRDAASGLPTGKRQHKPITITKRVDKSSPLFQAEGTEANNPLHESSMTIEQDGVAYQLHGVKVLSTTKNGDTETVTISYDTITTLPQAATIKTLKPKAAKATDYNSSRSNRTTNN